MLNNIFINLALNKFIFIWPTFTSEKKMCFICQSIKLKIDILIIIIINITAKLINRVFNYIGKKIET